MSKLEKRFKVALSFPGERRAFVEKVADHLATHIGREWVLYDKYYEAEFARPNLDTHLQKLYHDESELIAVFLCAEYAEKEWCGLEWRAIRELIKQRCGVQIMPFRFDDTEIAGFFSIDGYILVGERTPKQVSELIIERMDYDAGVPFGKEPGERANKSILGRGDEHLRDEVAKRLVKCIEVAERCNNTLAEVGYFLDDCMSGYKPYSLPDFVAASVRLQNDIGQVEDLAAEVLPGTEQAEFRSALRATRNAVARAADFVHKANGLDPRAIMKELGVAELHDHLWEASRKVQEVIYRAVEKSHGRDNVPKPDSGRVGMEREVTDAVEPADLKREKRKTNPVLFDENSALFPVTTQKIDKHRETLKHNQLTPWLWFNSKGVVVTRFDRGTINISGTAPVYGQSQAAVFWESIVPFLHDAIVTTLDDTIEICRIRGLTPKEPYIRETAMLLDGHLIDPIYRYMADIDQCIRGKGNPKSVVRRSVTDEITQMVKFLDKCKDEMIRGEK